MSHFADQVLLEPYLPDDLPDGPLCGNRPGMVASEPLTDDQKSDGRFAIFSARDKAIETANELARIGFHKQDANRYLEPFQWVRWVGTATNWDNFFALRTDHRAYPPFRFLARSMWVAYTQSRPNETRLHLPFITEEDWREAEDESSMQAVYPPDWFWDCRAVNELDDGETVYNLMAWSAARCARVSVKNFRTDSTDRTKDMQTFEKLITDTPKHSSPLEHQAFALDHWGKSHPRSNFSEPWFQFRKALPDETAWEFSPSDKEVKSWNIPDDVFGGTPGVDW